MHLIGPRFNPETGNLASKSLTPDSVDSGNSGLANYLNQAAHYGLVNQY